jgi:hypothetical protein
MQPLLLFHGNSGYENATHFTFTRILPVFSPNLTKIGVCQLTLNALPNTYWIFVLEFLRTYKQTDKKRNGEISTDDPQVLELA